MKSDQRLTPYTRKNSYYASNYARSFHRAEMWYVFAFITPQKSRYCSLHPEKSASLDKCQRLNSSHIWQDKNHQFFQNKKANNLPVTSKHVVYAQNMKRSPSVLIVSITVHRLRLDCTWIQLRLIACRHKEPTLCELYLFHHRRKHWKKRQEQNTMKKKTLMKSFEGSIDIYAIDMFHFSASSAANQFIQLISIFFPLPMHRPFLTNFISFNNFKYISNI